MEAYELWRTASSELAAERRESGVRATALGASQPSWRPPRPAALPGADARATVAEVLYRLAVGDADGARRVGAELSATVPMIASTGGVRWQEELGFREEYLLALVDGALSFGALVSRSPLAADDSLRGLCELVDRGLVLLW